ncbi:hypothetical protein ACIBI9_32870 [Nonomuraea sp. NPDC050451]|uniref:hypothetical protein n=1 Tax=Nonomuraea sp. NPDC050451 TaxID=3364364 RepID=UPI003795508C
MVNERGRRPGRRWAAAGPPLGRRWAAASALATALLATHASRHGCDGRHTHASRHAATGATLTPPATVAPAAGLSSVRQTTVGAVGGNRVLSGLVNATAER